MLNRKVYELSGGEQQRIAIAKMILKDPDLIFPKQEFNIVQDSSADEKAKAERLAKTRGPWSLYDNK